MDEEAERDMGRTFRRQNRAIICRRCGTLGTSLMDGRELADGMPGLKYKVCGSCGNAEPQTARRKRDKL